MKRTKPTVAAAGIPKNLCPRTFQTFKMEENKGYGAAPGMPRNLAKHEENETCGAAAGMSKNLPPGTLQMGGAPGMPRNLPKHEENEPNEQPRVFR